MINIDAIYSKLLILWGYILIQICNRSEVLICYFVMCIAYLTHASILLIKLKNCRGNRFSCTTAYFFSNVTDHYSSKKLIFVILLWLYMPDFLFIFLRNASDLFINDGCLFDSCKIDWTNGRTEWLTDGQTTNRLNVFSYFRAL